MHQVTVVRRNSYFDSVTLMSIGSEIKGREGVEEAVVSMATDLNKEILQNVGLATEETEAAGPNDFVVAVRAASKEACDAAVKAVDERLARKDEGRLRARGGVPHGAPSCLGGLSGTWPCCRCRAATPRARPCWPCAKGCT